ncbi:MAG: lactonase family protein [Bryobacteraceae bacterium]|nr:lactonase family protein [Bryobacteraceae bacterium]
MRFFLASALLLLPAFAVDSLVLVGTYSKGKSEGIYALRFSSSTGKLTPLGLAAKADNPSYLVIHPNRRWVFSVNEVEQYRGENSGSITAYTLDENTGKLTALNTVSSHGAAPCHLSLDRTGKFLLVANYTGGTVGIYPIRDDGQLGEANKTIQHTGKGVTPRQDKPHAHSINVSANNRYAVAADLGIDELITYRLRAGSLEPKSRVKLKDGSGPRHFAFHPSGKYAYSINELASTVSAFTWKAGSGQLREFQSLSTLPSGYTGNNSTAEVVVHPNGKFLYGSNRGHHSIAMFTIDAQGKLTAQGQVPSGGEWPRNFNIDPSGEYLIAANERSDRLAVFRIDAATGKLTATGETGEVGVPVCVKFLPAK